MNENPYAPPEEVVKTSEDERFEGRLRWLAWGLAWYFWSGISMIAVMITVSAASDNLWWMYDRLPWWLWDMVYRLHDLFRMLFGAAVFGFFVTQTLGLACFCFCPDRLLKWGRMHVLGSIGIMLTVMTSSFNLSVFYQDRFPLAAIHVFLIVGTAASIVVWHLLLLRLAKRVNSTWGKRLAWVVILTLCILAAMIVTFIIAGTHEDRLYEWDMQYIMAMPVMLAAMVYAVVYVMLLKALRRGVRRMLEEKEWFNYE